MTLVATPMAVMTAAWLAKSHVPTVWIVALRIASSLTSNRASWASNRAFFTAVMSALRASPLSPALLILGDMSVQGNIKPVRSLVEPLQVAMDNGAKRALIPIENKRSFLEVESDIVEHVDPIFYGDPKTAALKGLGI